MSEAEIRDVEVQLGVTLPVHYRSFLLAYPTRLIEAKLDLGWVQEAPADRQLYDNAERLIQLNRDVRLPGTPWVGEEGAAWPEKFFAVGDDQCGNYWSIDLLTEDRGVWFYDHEIGAFERQHDSLEAFEESVLAQIEFFNRECRS
ncbi:MAG: SMI1/KNR4 family protein [Gemmataceae bacterium]